MREVAKDVFCVGGTDVNWVLVRDGSDLTLIDSGWLGDREAVEESIRAIGHRPQDVRAILLTHAHLDHMGALNHMHDQYGTPVYMDPAEVTQARDGHLEQASPMDVALRAWRPSVLAWSYRIMRAGALKHLKIPHALPFPSEGALDLPGHPVPVACHGHSSGHSAYHLPGAGVVATGDALVTAHPTARSAGPQLLPSFFSYSPRAALAALDVLGELSADVLVPGHGAPWRGALSDAAARARRHVLKE
ncbi:MBL fold metallo-hydrolase [Kibdelosporangium phytohabitans]|uniref:MBL fold metallo-hydrolase n=1 Tax=Kibdelosporangium phytohabitans TaxID=860235 RepID=A0A0N9HZT8_9PSEU|nr:MBL fold metallo-hydrolase [Kibdelosporangium phytohabitans]ALG12862.1 MBL fold metallo-hydrolase [Kibdelosporangium phytohabitans]MBE1464560.1 glyoxylase-like metal-dependent hydrolase (beta-lactamase superfamily II) [Kibdelosporangium phytohabitans]